MSRVIGVASAIVAAAAGMSSRKIWRRPLDVSARRPSRSARGEAAERREQHRRDGDGEHPLGQHVDAEGGVDRARRLLGDAGAEDAS